MLGVIPQHHDHIRDLNDEKPANTFELRNKYEESVHNLRLHVNKLTMNQELQLWGGVQLAQLRKVVLCNGELTPSRYYEQTQKERKEVL